MELPTGQLGRPVVSRTRRHLYLGRFLLLWDDRGIDPMLMVAI
jgi:hypothetical protein